MATTLAPNFVKQYGSTLELLTQLKGNKFRGKCREETIVGEEAYFDQLGSVTAELRQDIFPDSPESTITHDRRQVVATSYDTGLYIDRIEKVQTLVEPEGKYVAQQHTALNRKRDQEFFKGALGTAKSGKAGGTDNAVTGCPIVPLGTGGDGMNLDKLINALYELEASGVDVEDPMDQPYFVWSPRQKNELLTNTQTTSSDYAAVKALVTGQIDSFYGFKFITSTLTPWADTAGTGVNLVWNSDGSTGDGTGADIGDIPGIETAGDNDRMCFAYTKNNIIQATNPEIVTEVAKRADKSFDWYAYALMRTGAVRMEEKKVVLVPCQEVAGGITLP